MTFLRLCEKITQAVDEIFENWNSKNSHHAPYNNWCCNYCKAFVIIWIFFYAVNCDCWRSGSKSPGRPSWSYSSGRVDAINFQTNGDVILRGYRLWGVISGSTSFKVTFSLYHDSTVLATKTGSYLTRSSERTFEVHFSRGISIRAGVTYTAAVTITTSSRSFHLSDGVGSTYCSGIRVTFENSAKSTNGSDKSNGQIPALIFRSSGC